MIQGNNAPARRAKPRFNSSTLTIFVIFVIMCAFMAAVSPAFIKITNVLSTARSFSAIAIAGVGVSMIIITGGIDLSLGSVYGLAGVVSALAITSWGVPLIPALALGIAVGCVVGALNGLMVVYLKLPPFIATLGTMQIARGVCYIATKGYPISGLPESFNYLGQGYLLGIPVPIWCMVFIAVVFAVFLNKTTTGRRIFALGGNEEATRISGINTKKLKVLVYTLSSALAALAGMITASKLGVGQPTAGNGFEMDAIAAVVIGGASLSGGEGTVTGTVIGAAIIGVLRNALVLLQVDSYWQTLIIGCVIIAAVSVDQLRKGKR
ncbi:ABC transporter permease [Bacillota bacterium Meth-B3]|nr:ABC transporter permease [Christensenellaceae bacterium]MEA5066115.1 ABC transporter permease [Eubacteriales bacterium]MEA5070153.1 ABC transporter permease [Christensenellaceae bacterium]